MTTGSKFASDCAQLIERATGRVLVPHLELATTFAQRFWGLQFRAEISADCGLLVTPCNSVHTCWMRFPIDVLFLDREGVVLKIRQNLRPWRATYPVWGAQIAVEVPVGTIQVQPSTKLGLVLPAENPCPESLRRLAGGGVLNR